MTHCVEISEGFIGCTWLLCHGHPLAAVRGAGNVRQKVSWESQAFPVGRSWTQLNENPAFAMVAGIFRTNPFRSFWSGLMSRIGCHSKGFS
jgi:hypothetical protein